MKKKIYILLGILFLFSFAFVSASTSFGLHSNDNKITVLTGNLTNWSQMADVSIDSPADKQFVYWDNGTQRWIKYTFNLDDWWDYDYNDLINEPTALSDFTDDLGNRGYTSVSNFTNDYSYYNSTTLTSNSQLANGYNYWNDTYATFNKTYADTLYSGIEWNYNQTIPAINKILEYSYYNSTDGVLSQWTTTGSDIYYNSGNVGIGTNSPSSTLNIEQTADSSGITINGYDDQSAEYFRLLIDSGGYPSIITSKPLSLPSIATANQFRFNDDVPLTFGLGSDYSIGYNNATDTLQIVDGSGIGSNVRMAVGSSGNIGIGTTSPEELTHISRGYLYIASDGGTINNGVQTSSGIKIGSDTVNKAPIIANWRGVNSDQQGIDFRTYSSGYVNAMRILNSGNVGIGTITPQNKLDIEGGAVIGATYSGTNTAPTNGLLVEGNVGIGTTSPLGLLHLDGGTTSSTILRGYYKGSAGSSKEIFRAEAVETAGPTESGRFTLRQDGTTKIQLDAQPNGNSYFNNGGNVGIGTTSPLADLQIGDASGNNTFRFNKDASSRSTLGFYSANTINTANIIIDENEDFTIQNLATNKDIIFDLNGGNVGIGTTSPGAKLTVYDVLSAPTDLGDWDNYHLVLKGSDADGAGAGILFSSSIDTYGGSAIYHYDTGAGGIGDLVFYTKQSTSAVAPEEVMRLTEEGYVGIGLNNPSVPLEVLGEFNVGDGTQVTRMYVDGSTNVIQPVNQVLTIRTTRDVDDIIFEVNDTEAMRIDATNQNVGIGASSPGRPLTVAGTDNLAFFDSAGNSYLTIDRSAANRRSALAFSTAGDGTSSIPNNISWAIGTADSDELGDGSAFFIGQSTDASFGKFIIDSNGKVGIGTTTPQNKLDIEGGAVIGSTYSGTNTAPTNGLLVEGNVGIATDSPEAKLAIGSGTPSGVQSGTPNDWGFYISSDYDASFNGYTTFNGPTYILGATLDTPLGYMNSAYGNTLALDLNERSLILTDYTNRHKNADHGDQPNPTLFIQSVTDPDTNNTQWVSLTHDQSNAVFNLGTGNYIFSNGSVGIGTANPQNKLNVEGSFNQSGDEYSFLNLPHGSLIYHNETGFEISLVTEDVFENMTFFDVNVSDGVSLLNSYTLRVDYSGTYKADFSLSFTGATDTYEMAVAINDVTQNTTARPHRRLANIADVGNMAGTGFLELNEGDIINLQLRDQDSPVNNPTAISGGISLLRIAN